MNPTALRDDEWDALGDLLDNQYWRLNHLYSVLDEQGDLQLFQLRPVQKDLLAGFWYRNLILKSRQHGFTTLMAIYQFDLALWNDNVQVGMIAHTKPDAQRIFRNKIKFAYEHLAPDVLRVAPRLKLDNTDEYVFDNGSSIYVGTSFRGGTLQSLHVSEFGKIAAKHPQKAEEIKTGAFEAVHQSGLLTVESTAEGNHGHFKAMVDVAQAKAHQKKDLTRLDFKLHFVPWWKDPKNRLSAADTRNTPINQRMLNYFAELKAKWGIHLFRWQQAWYVVKEETLGALMFREHPSTPLEPFKVSLDGAYWSEAMMAARKAGRITAVPHTADVPVDTWWDIGNDTTSIWFTQSIGLQVHVLAYYANSDTGIAHYIQYLVEIMRKRVYRYGVHNFPHDMDNTDWANPDEKSRKDVAIEQGLPGPAKVWPRMADKDNGIEAGRIFIQHCVFDEEQCEEGIAGLDAYRKEWDALRGVWKDKPLHDWASHPADAFQQLALYHKTPLQQQQILTQHGAREIVPQGRHF